RFLFPKFFPKKFGQKIGAGPPTGNFGNGLCAGRVLLHPAPPFVQMKDTRGAFFPPAFRQRSSGARQTFRLPGAQSRISICRSSTHNLQPHPSSRRDSLPCHISATLDPVTRTHARDLRAKSVQPVELPDSDACAMWAHVWVDAKMNICAHGSLR